MGGLLLGGAVGVAELGIGGERIDSDWSSPLIWTTSPALRPWAEEKVAVAVKMPPLEA